MIGMEEGGGRLDTGCFDSLSSFERSLFISICTFYQFDGKHVLINGNVTKFNGKWIPFFHGHVI
jgi:hypothetical protein